MSHLRRQAQIRRRRHGTLAAIAEPKYVLDAAALPRVAAVPVARCCIGVSRQSDWRVKIVAALSQRQPDHLQPPQTLRADAIELVLAESNGAQWRRDCAAELGWLQ